MRFRHFDLSLLKTGERPGCSPAAFAMSKGRAGWWNETRAPADTCDRPEAAHEPATSPPGVARFGALARDLPGEPPCRAGGRRRQSSRLRCREHRGPVSRAEQHRCPAALARRCWGDRARHERGQRWRLVRCVRTSVRAATWASPHAGGVHTPHPWSCALQSPGEAGAALTARRRVGRGKCLAIGETPQQRGGAFP